MTAIKERIIGAVILMSDDDANNIWDLIQSRYTVSLKQWNQIEEVKPDEYDLQMLKAISEDKDCQAFVSSKDALKELGL